MKKLSIIGRDYPTEQDLMGYYNAGPHEVLGQTGRFRGWPKQTSFGRSLLFVAY
jgi:hypothetical protein